MTEANEKQIHHGRNVKRFREMMGWKQEVLASALGEDWNQKRVSLLEAKAEIDPKILEQVALALKVPAEAIKAFDEQAATGYFNTFNDQSSAAFNNYNCTFNPLDKIIELYESKIALYERMLKEKDVLLERLQHRGL